MLEFDAHAGGKCDACGVEAEAVGQVDHGAEALVECAGELLCDVEALWWSEVPTGGDGASEATGDEDGVVRLCVRTEDGSPGCVWAADDGDGERERTFGSGDVPADHWAADVLGGMVDGVEEFVGLRVAAGECGGAE